ncbi:MAG: hypothetical protein AAGA77_16550 [Bacteroidota bacterium]
MFSYLLSFAIIVSAISCTVNKISEGDELINQEEPVSAIQQEQDENAL